MTKKNNKIQSRKKTFQTVTGGKIDKPTSVRKGNKIAVATKKVTSTGGVFGFTANSNNTSTKRNALGRGLQALLSPMAIPAEPIISSVVKQETFPSPVELLKQSSLENPEKNPTEIEPAIPSIVSATNQNSVEYPMENSPKNLNVSQENDLANAYTDGFEPIQIEQNKNTVDQKAVESEQGLIYAPVEAATPNKNQPRQNFSENDLESLTQSIRATGMLQPIIVRKINGSEIGPHYEIVAGERRWRAAQRAGLVKVPMLVRGLSDKEVLEIGIIENVQRSDLNPIEEAIAYQRLIEEFNQTQEEVALAVGKDRSSIANLLRLLKLPGEVQGLLTEGKLSPGHARAILKLSTPQAQKVMAHKIVGEGLSVRMAEKLCDGKFAEPENETKTKIIPLIKQKSPQIVEIEDRLRRTLGTKVSLTLSTTGLGELKVSFYSKAELENLLERLGA